ncbi:MAG: class I SAM-dependent methyltransferase [Acidimicrobiia bacterium]
MVDAQATFRQRMSAATGAALAEEAERLFCNACGSSGLVAFYEVVDVPTQTCLLLDDRSEAASYPLGDVLLALCERCGFIQNVRYDPDLIDYSMPTEESQAFSPRFAKFAGWLADEMVERYRLEGRTVLEVGCGKGDFLTLLGSKGIGHGLGIDPGFLPERVKVAAGEVEFRREWYGPETLSMTADLVITRHFMEHMPNVGEFFSWLRQSVSATPGASLFTEVPDVGRILREGAFWDVFYEHCSYFTLGSLARALRTSGFKVNWLQLGFEDQYLLAGATVGGGQESVHHGEESAPQIAMMVESFASNAADSLSRWRRRIDAVTDQGGRIALWGGASKTVSFISALGLTDVTVVDINPYKQGKWLPGIAIEVQEPAVLLKSRPDLVVPMNPIYTDEIKTDLATMGLEPMVVPV